MCLKNKDGFTLIEIIVSLAIIGILSVSFFTIFTSGFTYIAKAGNRSVAGFSTQNVVEQTLINIPLQSTSYMTITLPDTSTIRVYGNTISKTTNYNGGHVDITFFQPNN